MTAATAEASPFKTIDEVASFLRISRNSVGRLIASGQLRAVRVSPERIRIPVEELNRYLARRWIDRLVTHGEQASSTNPTQEIANEA
jgi:excisionase family DNA binding protein